jgi:hypothetical protein
MAPTYGTPLYLLAFDHRSSFERGLFGAVPPVSPAVHDGIVRADRKITTVNRPRLSSPPGGWGAEPRSGR